MKTYAQDQHQRAAARGIYNAIQKKLRVWQGKYVSLDNRHITKRRIQGKNYAYPNSIAFYVPDFTDLYIIVYLTKYTNIKPGRILGAMRDSDEFRGHYYIEIYLNATIGDDLSKLIQERQHSQTIIHECIHYLDRRQGNIIPNLNNYGIKPYDSAKVQDIKTYNTPAEFTAMYQTAFEDWLSALRDSATYRNKALSLLKKSSQAEFVDFMLKGYFDSTFGLLNNQNQQRLIAKIEELYQNIRSKMGIEHSA